MDFLGLLLDAHISRFLRSTSVRSHDEVAYSARLKWLDFVIAPEHWNAVVAVLDQMATDILEVKHL